MDIDHRVLENPGGGYNMGPTGAVVVGSSTAAPFGLSGLVIDADYAAPKVERLANKSKPIPKMKCVTPKIRRLLAILGTHILSFLNQSNNRVVLPSWSSSILTHQHIDIFTTFTFTLSSYIFTSSSYMVENRF